MLAKRYAEQDGPSPEKLVRSHMDLVRKIAWHLHGRVGRMVRRLVGGLCPDEQITTMLGPAEQRGDRVGHQGCPDEAERGIGRARSRVRG